MSTEASPFLQCYRGSFRSALRWEHLDKLWQTLRERLDDRWYVYAVGEQPPAEPARRETVVAFIDEIDALLRREHDEDYCGVVYADDLAAPTFIKIYDPNNLGSVCGPSFGPPPLPGWILCRVKPVDLESAVAPPANRRRWWARLFGG